ncbi:MAG: Uma2 family endonuclease, partial [Bacteroidota bacterium]
MPSITSIDQLDLNKHYTYTDYLTWQFQERVELWRGKVNLILPKPNTLHQSISGNLTFLLANFLRKTDKRVYCAPFDVHLPLPPHFECDGKASTVVQPDICVICDKNKLDDLGGRGAPDLVIEILIPGNIKREAKG